MRPAAVSRTAPHLTQVEVATSADEFEALFRFRYRISVEEMGRRERYADHQARLLSDSLDAAAINLVARHGDELVGCLRINLGSRGDFGYYTDFYEIGPESGYAQAQTAIVTRLMIAKRYRHSGLVGEICAAAFSVGVQHGVRWCFIDCQAVLVPFFSSLGFSEYSGPKIHHDYGESRRMRLDLGGRQMIDRVGGVLTLGAWRTSAVT